jgi:hypothetical protein
VAGLADCADSTPLLIDNVSGALAAYSLRRVRRAYTGPA